MPADARKSREEENAKKREARAATKRAAGGGGQGTENETPRHGADKKRAKTPPAGRKPLTPSPVPMSVAALRSIDTNAATHDRSIILTCFMS